MEARQGNSYLCRAMQRGAKTMISRGKSATDDEFLKEVIQQYTNLSKDQLLKASASCQTMAQKTSKMVREAFPEELPSSILKK